MIISVHGVRRLEDSAVIYLSVANPEGGAEITASSYLGNQLSMFAGGSGSQLENVAAVDQAGGKAYAGLKGPGHTSCFCTKSNNLDAEPGQVVQARGDPRQVADAVAVAVQRAAILVHCRASR